MTALVKRVTPKGVAVEMVENEGGRVDVQYSFEELGINYCLWKGAL